MIHHAIYKDSYLKNIPFRPLYKKLHYNDKQSRMGIKVSKFCGFCKEIDDSVEHSLFHLKVSNNLSRQEEEWVFEHGKLQSI